MTGVQTITDPAIAEFVLAFADDEHMIGARHAEWIGTAPFLEEDLAFCSIAQDELGHALGLYELLTDDVDRFALLRPAADYRSCHFTERATPNWDDALIRHWLYDTAEALRWESLLDSSIPELAALARRALREEAFHTQHAELLLERVLPPTGRDTNTPTRPSITAAIERLLPDALTMFEPVAGEPTALDRGVTSASSATIGERWTEQVSAMLRRFELDVDWPEQPPASHSQNGRGRTERSAGFADFHASLQEVIRIDPVAVW